MLQFLLTFVELWHKIMIIQKKTCMIFFFFFVLFCLVLFCFFCSIKFVAWFDNKYFIIFNSGTLIPNYRSLLFNKRPWLDWVTKMSEWTQHHFSMPPDIYWVLYRTSLETRCQSCEISDIWYSPSAPIHIRAPWICTDQKWGDLTLQWT